MEKVFKIKSEQEITAGDVKLAIIYWFGVDVEVTELTPEKPRLEGGE